MSSNQDIASAFTALSHKRRVLIFNELRKEGAAVSFGALMSKTGLSSTTLSHHLGPMIKAGLVKRQVRGSFSFLSLRLGPWRETIDAILPRRKSARPTPQHLQSPDHRPTAF